MHVAKDVDEYNDNLDYQSLKSIKDISLTTREVDIIACLLNNRGEKKIAALLFISPRTVSAHTRNILQKLGCNSREGIIDFIETSGKLKLFRKHYTSLLVATTFKSYLSKIGKLYNKNILVIELIAKEVIKIDEISILRQLQPDLKLANVILTTGPVNQKLQTVATKTLKANVYINYLLQEVRLTFEQDTQLPSMDFTQKGNYYFSVLKLLQTIINKSELKQINQEFQRDYQALYNSYEQGNFVLANNKSGIDKNYYLSRVVPLLFFISISILLCLYFYSSNTNRKINSNSVDNQLQLEQDIKVIIREFSANNTTADSLQNNQELVKKVEHILRHIIFRKIHDLSHTVILPSELTCYLHIIHELASYYMYNEHDALKAREILGYAKHFAEAYVMARSKIKFNFANLANEEIYTELSLIKNLPETYTKITYFLGRTYIYIKDDTKDSEDQAIKYFELAKYLGTKLKLFEGYLSTRSGIAIIAGDQAIAFINRDNQEAAKKLAAVIKIYKKLRNDDTSYILQQQPCDERSQFIIPTTDTFNQITCINKIIKYYGYLILLTAEKAIQQQYLQEIANQLRQNMAFLQSSTQLTAKTIAATYITIGNIFLIFHDKNLDFQDLKQVMTNKLHLQSGNNLAIIEQIFKLANNSSRSTEFTKADSYEGLIQVYKRLLTQTIDQKQQDELSAKMHKLAKQRSQINKLLNRKVDYESI